MKLTERSSLEERPTAVEVWASLRVLEVMTQQYHAGNASRADYVNAKAIAGELLQHVVA